GAAAAFRSRPEPGRRRLETGGRFGSLSRRAANAFRFGGHDSGGGSHGASGGHLEGAAEADALEHGAFAGSVVQPADARVRGFGRRSALNKNSVWRGHGAYGFILWNRQGDGENLAASTNGFIICGLTSDLSSRAERGICSLLNIKRITGRLVRTDGSEIAEVAVVLPLVFMLLLGIVWFGRAFNIYSTIQQAAQQGAITAARATCATCSTSNTFPVDATVTGAVEAVMKSSNLDTTQILANAPSPIFCTKAPDPAGACSTSIDNITVCRSVQVNPPTSTRPPQCGTILGFQ